MQLFSLSIKLIFKWSLSSQVEFLFPEIVFVYCWLNTGHWAFSYITEYSILEKEFTWFCKIGWCSLLCVALWDRKYVSRIWLKKKLAIIISHQSLSIWLCGSSLKFDLFGLQWVELRSVCEIYLTIYALYCKSFPKLILELSLRLRILSTCLAKQGPQNQFFTFEWMTTPAIHNNNKQQTTTNILRPFFPLSWELAFCSPWQSPPFHSTLCIISHQTSNFHVPLNHFLPCHFWSSPTSAPFYSHIHTVLHPIIPLLPQHMPHPSQPAASHYITNLFNAHTLPQLSHDVAIHNSNA